MLAGDDDPIIPLVNATIMHTADPGLPAARLRRRAPRPHHREPPSSRRHRALRARLNPQETRHACHRPHHRLLRPRAAAHRRGGTRCCAACATSCAPRSNRSSTTTGPGSGSRSSSAPAYAKLGIAGAAYEGFGCPGGRPLLDGMISMEIARIDPSIATFHGVHSGLAMGSIVMCGSEEQKQRWLPAMARRRRSARSGSPSPTSAPAPRAGSPRRRAETANGGSWTARRTGSATRRSPTS